MENSVGCSNGKTILIDPNAFDGQSSSNNFSVPLEDLSIMVQLETKKKARTILTTSGPKNIGNSTGSVKLKFIEGTKTEYGERNLTTRYTDLTTDLNTEEDGEDLGITSIEIDFNSSYAPMVTIQFIDIRGSSVFQNEANLSNGSNKYSSFFQLPYPIFYLTIKGYYGMPVKYQLHMRKFTAKFNSQTGNFEITATFIGYTYAMLNDMLLGYLRAIPYTSVGIKRYKEINDRRKTAGLEEIMNLDDLMTKISLIDISTKKIKSDDPDSAQVKNGVSKIEDLNIFKSLFLTLGQEIDILKNQTSEYRFIFVSRNIPNQDDITKNALIKYYADVEPNIKTFNEGNPETKKTGVVPEIKLNSSDFTGAGFSNGIYKDLSFDKLTFSSDPLIESVLKESFSNKVKNNVPSGEIENLRKTLLSVANERGFKGTLPFDVYDLNKQYDILSKTEIEITKQIKILEKSLAVKLRSEIENTIGLDPTIRNIISIFTTAAEVFLGCIFDISAAASKNTLRTDELKIFEDVKGSSDIKETTLDETPDGAPSGKLTPIYYPWPDYRVDEAINGLTETYLGDPGILKNPNNVNELVFINELLKAFLTSHKKADDAAQILIADETNWLPVNPLDTRLFIDKFPYKRFDTNSIANIINYILIRAFTYIGLTNNGLTPNELQAIANAEADSLLADIPEDSIIEALKLVTIDDFKDAKGMINGDKMLVMKYLSSEDSYYYNFIYGNPSCVLPIVCLPRLSKQEAEEIHILPISDGFTETEGNSVNEWPNVGLNKPNIPLVKKSKNGSLFLTNYTADGAFFNKIDDGGIYMKILNSTDYDGLSVKQLPTTEPSDNIISLIELSKNYDEFKFELANFNQFGGKYGIQEYRFLNFGKTGLEKAAFMSMFFQDGLVVDAEGKSNGLALKRTKGLKTDFDKTNYGTYEIISRTGGGFTDSAFENLNEIIDGSSATHARYGDNILLLNEYINTKSNEITYPFINFQVETLGNVAQVSLFGSRLYYEQTQEKSKALLFLHTFPWKGLCLDQNNKYDGIFNVNEILNTFGNRGGFISAPKLWVAFIGGLLWRSDLNASGPTDPILFGDSTESFIPTYSLTSKVPTRDQYITENNKFFNNVSPMTFPEDTDLNTVKFKPLDLILRTLPSQIKQEFIEAFNKFVISDDSDDSDWTTIKNKLEVFTGNGPLWVATWNIIMYNPLAFFNGTNNFVLPTMKLNETIMRTTYNLTNDGKPNFDSYIIFAPYYDEPDFKYNYILELKDDAPAVDLLLQMLTSEVIIANMSYKPWQQKNIAQNLTNISGRSGIYIKSNDLTIYLNTILSKFKPIDGGSLVSKVKQDEQEIFGTDNENLIKLQLYRTCKNLYDKWVGGTSDDDIFFQGNDNRNDIDKKLAEKYTKSEANLNLIDSFRFVDRSFSDIGDKLIINPVPVGEFLRSNPNSSLYDSVGSLLSANNFDFIALPTYINYGDPKTLESMFKPMSSNDAFKIGTVGPAFVCVYVGQTSKHLDFNSSEYTNDGVTFRCDSNGTLINTKAKDFSNLAETFENKVAVFAVNYGQQNQNIFKDIILDQGEFGETAESILITDEIATKGAENKKTFGGQNLYNVNSVRSYKTEIEMMGNAMIQPMMYFQLNNIPMFHGAYMITHVKHSIKPNSMSTNFTGVRIRNVATPLLDANDIFMSLLDSIEASSVLDTKEVFGGGKSALFDTDAIPDPSVASLFVNPYEVLGKAVINSAPGVRNLDGSIRNHAGVDFGVSQGTNLISIADGVVELLKYNYSKGVGYGLYMVINHDVLGSNKKVYKSVYGHLSELDSKIIGHTINQLTPSEISKILTGFNPGTVVKKGQVIGKSGGIKGKNFLQQSPQRYDLAGGSTGAHLHYELHIGEEKEIKSSFLSIKYVNAVPYLPLGQTAIYKNGNISNNNTDILLNSNADYWSLVAISSLENNSAQGRCDVAQSIYNRLASKKYKGNSIKELIITPLQYEPVGRAVKEFNLISSKDTAIAAVIKSKKYSLLNATKAIEDTVIAFNNSTLTSNSASFIGGRTDFYSTSIRNQIPSNAIKLVERDDQIFGFFVGPGSIAYGNTGPSATPKPTFV